MNQDELKALLYRRAVAEATGFGLRVDHSNSSADKPWGAYLRIAEESLPQFYDCYWKGVDVPQPAPGLRLDPKILIVSPGARLSLQYHHRRGEHWRVLDGPVQVDLGEDGATLHEIEAGPGEVLRIPQGKWHRLVGLKTWGRIAEIWEHTDPANPSGEEDIVRVQDDYGR
jgi:mannose-6-phosphate isomerase-like protein (cupin superfamily)